MASPCISPSQDFFNAPSFSFPLFPSLPLSHFLPFFPFFPYLMLYLPHILSPHRPPLVQRWPLNDSTCHGHPSFHSTGSFSFFPLHHGPHAQWSLTLPCHTLTQAPAPPSIPSLLPQACGFWDSYLRKPFLFPLSLFWINDLNALSPVPGLLCYLLTMGVARVSKSLGKVQFGSHFLWRPFFESFIWQNGKNSWSGNKTAWVKQTFWPCCVFVFLNITCINV